MLTRTLIVLFLLLTFDSTVDAQLVHKYGIKGGASISNIRIPNRASLFRSTPFIPNENVTNPFAGIFLQSDLLESVPIQMEVFYARMGASLTLTIPVTTEQSPETPEYYVDYITEIGLHYIVAGLTANPGISFGSTTVYARIGPTINYLVTMTNLAEFKNTTNRCLLGYQIGLGVQFDSVMEHSLLIELTHARNFDYFYKSYLGDYYNVSWFLTAGISI